MSYRTGPKIVTDGLVLCLDAGDRNSYPGSGSTWYDLNNNNNGTLANGTFFNSENLGTFAFDGTNDFISCGNASFSSNVFSLEVVFKWDDYNTNNIGFLVAGNYEQLEIHTGGGAGTNGLRFVPYDGPAPNHGIIDAKNIITDDINHVIFTASYSAVSKAYKNGQLFLSSTSTSSVPLSGTQTVSIGRRTNNTYFFDGNIYLVRIYNKALSASEVLQNYHATKGRYGL